ncbi:MAG: electron transport complex subunit E [candidate division WOR-3 bacterium]|nr:electron transport complex subunit E [candidate division WOR-3 bacterium]
MSLKNNFLKGIWNNNPVLILLLGFCPVLAVSTTVIDALGMGISTTFVLLGSNIVISLIRGFVPKKMRIPVFIVVIATFVTIVDLVLYGFFFELHKSLGLFIPLIVVNCIVLGRAEAFASKNSLLDSIVDALGMGVGFILAIVVLAAIREILGNGTIMGLTLFPQSYQPVIVAILPPGAFITLGFMLAGMNRINIGREQREKARKKALKAMKNTKQSNKE